MKKLNIAFIWHFHQPNYQRSYDDDFLLPWVRLHASKDYLDMLLRIEEFDNLKLNFNFSPILLKSMQRYLKGQMDLHQKLLLKDTEKFSAEDKIFVLNNYFDLNYKNMVLKRPYFTELYNRRANAKELNLDMFTPQEYSDIMANYTLCWIDEIFKKDYPQLSRLFDKEIGYSLEDRNEICDIQIDIIRRIFREYKKYQNEGRIEISTSPYYHPILPLLLDFKGKEIKNHENLPENFTALEDAKAQIKKAIDKYHDIFGCNPKGMWLSEQCICPKTAQLLSEYGIKWTVLDEGLLSKSTKTEFIRDFEGNLENPFNLNQNYITKGKNPLNLMFADAFFAHLINFSYGNYDPKIAANDLYEKIKIVQAKLQTSPLENHVLTIALDGENCWEMYQNDGEEFLSALYFLISSDDTLETVLVSDYIEKNKPQALETLKGGSWINRNFDLWIGEPTKNIAWLYLASVREDFEKYKNDIKKLKDKKEILIAKEKIDFAQYELLIAQGSDWYWWYGEPNESKSDGVFDYLFRSHLMNVYRILGLDVPQYLTIPLAGSTTRPLRNPFSKITPSLKCNMEDTDDEWENAGYIFIPDGPTANISRLIKNIRFGRDDNNIYFRFELNKNSRKLQDGNIENQIAIYFADEKSEYFSPIRFVSKNENIYPIAKNQFSNEVRFVINKTRLSRIFMNKSAPYGLWSQLAARKSKANYKNDVIEIKISVEDLQIINRHFNFFILDASNELINEVYPQDVLIDL
ncbi:MAG: hypothetical protein IJD57_07795 [Candidatus Gastranaerophilales bacterium]|nr:hypothetical protein [Candidatus Gastranaerophilales bacterium]